MAYLLYVIEFPNGKRYFGITSKTIRHRWMRHCSDARRGSNLPVHQAIMRYGTNNLVPQVLALGEKHEILSLEIEFIRFFRTTDRSQGYNVGLGGETSPMSSPEVAAKRAGRRHSAETLKKMSKPHIMTDAGRLVLSSRAGIPLSEKTRDKIRVARANQIITPESNLKRSQTQTGRKVSLETRQKMSATRNTSGLRSSPEHMEMLRQLSIGRKHSDETKAKMSAAHKRLGTRPPNRWKNKNATEAGIIPESDIG
jgi:group I intron endonuclease